MGRKKKTATLPVRIPADALAMVKEIANQFGQTELSVIAKAVELLHSLPAAERARTLFKDVDLQDQKGGRQSHSKGSAA